MEKVFSNANELQVDKTYAVSVGGSCHLQNMDGMVERVIHPGTQIKILSRTTGRAYPRNRVDIRHVFVRFVTYYIETLDTKGILRFKYDEPPCEFIEV